jgi:tetratricopeptide (TPR) repeat protein
MQLKILSAICLVIFLGMAACVYAGEYRELAAFHREKGLTAFRNGEFDQAIESLRKAREFDPSWPDIYNDMGIVYEEQADWSRAEIMYLKALEHDFYYAPAYSNLAILYEEQSDFPRAIYYFKKRIDLGPADDPWVEMARQRVKTLEEFSATSLDPEKNSYRPSALLERSQIVGESLDTVRFVRHEGEPVAPVEPCDAACYDHRLWELRDAIDAEPCGAPVQDFLRTSVGPKERAAVSDSFERYFFFCKQGYPLLAREAFDTIKGALVK